jgi:hypothetical protein
MNQWIDVLLTHMFHELNHHNFTNKVMYLTKL